MILLMFSGGVDSTYLLWHYLYKTKEKVHCHHINIINRTEPRHTQEKIATESIYKFCRLNYRGFDSSFSTYEFPCFTQYVGWDYEVHLLSARNVAGNLAKNHTNGKVRVVIGAIKDDLQSGRTLDRYNRGVGKAVWLAMHSTLDANLRIMVEDEVSLPLVEMGLSKSDIIKEMPQELFNLTWSCRRPRNGSPCGTCHSCKTLTRSL